MSITVKHDRLDKPPCSSHQNWQTLGERRSSSEAIGRQDRGCGWPRRRLRCCVRLMQRHSHVQRQRFRPGPRTYRRSCVCRCASMCERTRVCVCVLGVQCPCLCLSVSGCASTCVRARARACAGAHACVCARTCVYVLQRASARATRPPSEGSRRGGRLFGASSPVEPPASRVPLLDPVGKGYPSG
jgi:hypothetical protein